MVGMGTLLNLIFKFSVKHPLLVFMIYSWLLLAGFFFYASARESWQRLHISIKILISPFLVLFVLADVLFDMVPGTIIFFELPRWFSGDLTFSARCEYHFEDTNYRGSVAGMYCRILNSILPGHCVGKVRAR